MTAPIGWASHVGRRAVTWWGGLSAASLLSLLVVTAAAPIGRGEGPGQGRGSRRTRPLLCGTLLGPPAPRGLPGAVALELGAECIVGSAGGGP